MNLFSVEEKLTDAEVARTDKFENLQREIENLKKTLAIQINLTTKAEGHKNRVEFEFEEFKKNVEVQLERASLGGGAADDQLKSRIADLEKCLADEKVRFEALT